MERPDLDAIEQVLFPDAEHVDILIAYARYLENEISIRKGTELLLNERLNWFENLLTKLRPAPRVGQPLLGHVWRNELFKPPLDDPYKHPHT
jgi:hypothetical protein